MLRSTVRSPWWCQPAALAITNREQARSLRGAGGDVLSVTSEQRDTLPGASIYPLFKNICFLASQIND